MSKNELVAKIEALNEWEAVIEEAKAEGYVRYTRVGSVLSETAGVVDYTGLLINNTAANIAITVDDYPTVGTINLTDTEA